MPVIAIVLLIAAALGGGTAVIAQKSLPGDPLWGFKVNVNESVEGALATGDEAKADWDIAAIKNRIAEAQELDAQGKLSAGVQADILNNFNEHAQGAADAIQHIEVTGSAVAAADAAARLQAAVAQFTSLSGSSGSTEDDFMTSVRSALNAASALSAQTSASAAAADAASSQNQ